MIRRLVTHLADEALDAVAFVLVGTKLPLAGWAFDRVLRRFS